MANIMNIKRPALTKMDSDQLGELYQDVDSKTIWLLGSILLEARLKTKDNEEFGKWREKYCSDLTSIQASKYMNVARAFLDEKVVKQLGATKASIISEPRYDAIRDEAVIYCIEEEPPQKKLQEFLNNRIAPTKSRQENKANIKSKATKDFKKNKMSPEELSKMYADVEAKVNAERAEKKRRAQTYVPPQPGATRRSGEVMKIANALYHCNDDVIIEKVRKYLNQLLHPDKAGSDRYAEAFSKLNGGE